MQQFAKEQRIQLSMGRTGSRYDNAVTESFFHTLKTEHIYFVRYDTRLDARTSIFDYIETFYNQRRLHSTIEIFLRCNLNCKRLLLNSLSEFVGKIGILPFKGGKSRRDKGDLEWR